MISLRNRRLARTLGARLTLSACAAFVLVAATTNAPGLPASGTSSRATTFRPGVKLVELVTSPDIPEVDIIGTQDGTWSVPLDWFSFIGDSNMVTVTVMATRSKPPTCTFTSTLSNTNLVNMLSVNEGVHPHVYPDSQGHPSVGVGFNLDRPDAAKTLASVGASYNSVRSGRADLTQTQIKQLLGADVAASITRAKHYFHTFDSLNPGQQAALVDMAYNLGNKLTQFTDFVGYMNVGDYADASTAALKSLWAFQVGARSVRDADNLIACH